MVYWPKGVIETLIQDSFSLQKVQYGTTEMYHLLRGQYDKQYKPYQIHFLILNIYYLLH